MIKRDFPLPVSLINIEKPQLKHYATAVRSGVTVAAHEAAVLKGRPTT